MALRYVQQDEVNGNLRSVQIVSVDRAGRCVLLLLLLL